MKKSDIRTMSALSVIQPWAYCIVSEGKNVENRPRVSHQRGTFAIHASMGRDQDRFDWAKQAYGLRIDIDEVAFGAIVGFATLVDVIKKRDVTRNTKKWFVGTYGYVLADMIALPKPVPISGMLGFWTLKGAPLRKCLDQLSAKQIARFEPFGYPEEDDQTSRLIRKGA